jgi:hypothetical protein
MAIGIACVTVIACRQLVGISDDPPTATGGHDAGAATACGLVVPGDTCRECEQQKCCNVAAACAASPACKENEECVAACAGEPVCAARCQLAHPVGVIAEVPAFDQCVASNCAYACGLKCGGLLPSMSDVDASAVCQACIAGNVCNEQQACAVDLSCQRAHRCSNDCVTLDCQSACFVDGAPADGGLSTHGAFRDKTLGKCLSACDMGRDWDCVGHLGLPISSTTAITVQIPLLDFQSSQPSGGVVAQLCGLTDGLTDSGCANPQDTMTTKADGMVVLHGKPNDLKSGLEGFLDLRSPTDAIVPELFFWEYPAGQPNARLAPFVATVTPLDLGYLLREASVQAASTSGHVAIAAFDCKLESAAGVTFVFPGGTPAGAKIIYTDIFLNPDFNATETTNSGIAYIANVPEGTWDLDIVPSALGHPTSHVTFYVRRGTISSVVALPASKLL